MVSAHDIDALLPQTQCTRCGYNGCQPYAEALAAGLAEINQCPPGGAATIGTLATLLGRAPLPLNPANGLEGPPLVAQIDEEVCIGCARCLPPCPVDCIAMVPRASLTGAAPAPAPGENRARFDARGLRLAQRAGERATLVAARKQAAR
jgi:RnfABCDGE-type electron transport complex B subunit